ncbi:MAG: hypothetical protein AABZ53_09200 [Planctomycetota bacterium]
MAAPNGVQLLVGGAFVSPAYLARFTGSGFASVGAGLDGEVRGITRHDDGSGSRLYVTGFVNVPMSGAWTVCYARLNGGTFESFGPPNGPGSWTGPAVSYNLGLGAKFLTSGGFAFPCDYVTQWSGTGWECLGGGLGSVVHEAVVYDDGTGAALFCVGSLIINDLPLSSSIGIGKWTGTHWEGVGGIGDGFGQCCTVFDDGSGPELFVGGSFSRVGTGPSVQAANIAKWNGHRWAALSTGTDRIVRALAPFDDGSGMKLYAAGDFTRAGATTAARLARWDGANWSACPAGGLPAGTVNAMIAHDPDGSGVLPAELVLTGSFASVGGGSVAAGNFAVLHRGENPADFNGDGAVDFFDYDAFVVCFEGAGCPPSRTADFDGDGAVDFFDYDAFVVAFEAGC